MALEWSNNLYTLYTCPLGQIEIPGWLIQFLQEGTDILWAKFICPMAGKERYFRSAIPQMARLLNDMSQKNPEKFSTK